MDIGLLFSLMTRYFLIYLKVRGANSFPPPLSAKQEHEYFVKMSNGDRDARNKLIEHNLRLVAHIVRKYYSSAKEQDDLVSIGTIGLIKAIDSYKYESGTKFATYAGKVISNEILLMARKERYRNRLETVSMETRILPEEDITLEDAISDKRNCYEEIESLLDIQRKLQYLRPKDRELVLIKLSDPDIKQEEIAMLYGHSQSYISRRLKNIKEKIVEGMAV